MTFLFVTNARDLTTDYVVREMKRRNHTFFRLNTETIAASLISINPCTFSFEIRFPDCRVNLEEIRAAYFRRPETPKRILPGIADDDWTYAAGEWNALLKSLYLSIGGRWLSHPGNIMLAEDKPRQLITAVKIGLKVPESVISNDLDIILALTKTGLIIGKPLKEALFDESGAGSIIFTSLVPGLSEKDRSCLEVCPAIYQKAIEKEFDVRVTVVGSQAFSAAIYSQGAEISQTDWRRGSNPDLPHRPIELPPETEAMCIRLVQALDLRFGAIDMICDKEGEFWFLECNPNGQWAWIENRTGLPISAAIVDELERIASS
jgi:glutathione synthase/RimK-type ligase-like ATP-grasp enzyme